MSQRKHKHAIYWAAIAAMGLVLSACGGSSGSREPTTEQHVMRCEAGGGQWDSANQRCIGPEELAMQCRSSGGQWNAENGRCQTQEELAMQCEEDGGQWENGQCTPAGTLAMERAEQQRQAIKEKIESAEMAIKMVTADAGDEALNEAEQAIEAAREAVMAATDIPAHEREANEGTVEALMLAFETAKMERMQAMEEATEKQAKTLLGAIQYGNGDGTMTAAFDADSGALKLTDQSSGVTTLEEDTAAAIADLHGWKGQRYVLMNEEGDISYEAHVYANVEAPTPGRKFGSADPALVKNGENEGVYEYQLMERKYNITGQDPAEYVALPSVTKTSGTETFKLPDPNEEKATVIQVAGSFHGVPGTYSCAPGDGSCTATVAGKGFKLGGGEPTGGNSNPTTLRRESTRHQTQITRSTGGG